MLVSSRDFADFNVILSDVNFIHFQHSRVECPRDIVGIFIMIVSFKGDRFVANFIEKYKAPFECQEIIRNIYKFTRDQVSNTLSFEPFVRYLLPIYCKVSRERRGIILRTTILFFCLFSSIV